MDVPCISLSADHVVASLNAMASAMISDCSVTPSAHSEGAKSEQSSHNSLLRIPSTLSYDINRAETGFDREISPFSASSDTSAVSASRRRVSESLGRDFIRAASIEDETASAKRKLHKFRTSLAFSNFIALVIFVDAYSNCRDIDARAAGATMPLWLRIVSDVCLGVYTLEVFLCVSRSLLRDIVQATITKKPHYVVCRTNVTNKFSAGFSLKMTCL